MSRGGSSPGWGWWPPSRRRPGRRRRPAAEGDGANGGRAWALPAVAGLAVAASLSLLVLLLGLSGAALSVAAAAGGAWVAATAAGKGRKPSLPARPVPTSAFFKAGALANGGPAMSCSPAGRKPLHGDHLTPLTHFALRRRYPIKKAQYASLGTLPSIFWDGYRRKTRLSVHHSSLVQSPVTVKIAQPNSNIGRAPLLEQLASPLAFSSTPNTPLDPCAKETVLSALKESRKRNAEDDQSFQGNQENKRRRHDSSGSGQSAFEPLVANGGLASLVPKPGSLKRSLASHCLDNGSSKRSRTSSLSSVNSLCVGGVPSSIRNAIASSYSSSRGLSQLWKRSGTSPLSSPASSRSQTPERPAKKARHPESGLIEAESHQSSASTPVTPNTERQAEKNAETPVQRRHSPLSLQSSGSHGKRKRKIQLLSARHGDNFTLPPPPQVGYTVTSEDLDAEKKATLQWFNKVLEEKTDSTPSTSAEIASPPGTLMPAKPASMPLTGMAGTNPLFESLKKMQEGHSGVVQADSASAAQTPETTAPTFSLGLVSPVSAASSDVKPSPTLSVPLSSAPSSSTAAEPASSTGGLVTTSSELGQTPSRPSSAPKPSILFGILTSPPASQSPAATVAAAAASVSNTAPVFKPIFGNVAKVESPAFSASTASVAVTPSPGAVPSSAPPPVTVSSSNTFKPIFGSVPPLTTAAPPTTTTTSFFAFKNTTQPDPAPSFSTTASSTSSGFPVLSEPAATTAMSPSATVSATAVSTSASVFSFGLGMPASTSAPSTVTTVTTASSQPFMFGVPSCGAATSSVVTAPLFQFGKPSTTSGPSNALASSAFSQAPASTAESVPSSTATAAAGFNIFSSGATTNQTPSAAPPSTQPALTFGSGPSAFSGAFSTPSKPPPPYTGDGSQLTFEPGVPDGQQQLGTKPTASPVSFGTPFNFAGSVAQPTAQPAFGSTTQTSFGSGTGPLASFGTKNPSQPAFGATTSIFSFGTATTSAVSAFGSNTQTTNSGTVGSVFGGSTPSPFTFGASSAPTAAGGTFGIGAPAASGSSNPMVGFSFGGQSGTVGTATPFASSLAQIPLGVQNQSTPFAFNIPGTPDNKPAFGGTPTPTFGQSTPAPGGATGSNLSFGTPNTPAFGGSGPTFGPPAPAFSIGAGSKTMSRQRLQARRQHTRKK